MTDDTQTQEIIDGEAVKVVRTERLGAPSAVPAITEQTEVGVRMFEERVKSARKQLKAALQLTQPGQWKIMDGGDGKQTVYATAGAADRILRMGFGMRWGQKVVNVEANDDAIVATCTADLITHDGQVYETFTGTRRAPFDEQRDGGIRGFLKNEQDIIKGAIANLKHRAVTELLGLTFLSPDDFRELGLDLSRSQTASFQTRSTATVNNDGGGTPRVPFGKNKGKPITELNDKSLDWYIGRAKETIADPAQAKWKAKEERWLASLEAELASRTGGGSTINGVPDPDEMPAWDDGENS